MDEQKFKEFYQRQKESGLSIKEFCSNEVLAPSTFYYWQKKLREAKRLPGFIPLVVKQATPLTQNSQVKGINSPAINSNSTIDDVYLELVYPNGTMLRLKKDLDFSHLRALVHLCD